MRTVERDGSGGQLTGEIGRELVDLPEGGLVLCLSRRDCASPRPSGVRADVSSPQPRQRVLFRESSHHLRPLVRLRRLAELP